MRLRRPTLLVSAVASTALVVSLAGCSLSDYVYEPATDVPAEYTAPGTEMPADGVARVVNDDPKVDLAISVLEFSELDASHFDRFENAEEFSDYTPFVAVVQYDTLGEVTGDNRPSFETLGGMLSNGSFAEALTSDGFGPNSACPYSVDSTNGGDGTWRIDCTVYLVPSGETLTSIGFYGYNPYGIVAFIEAGNEEFEENPITWKAPA